MNSIQFPQAITSLVDQDQYKFTEAYYRWQYHRDAVISYELINRTKGERLAEIFTKEALIEQLNSVRELRFTEPELAFLQGTGMFTKTGRAFIEELRSFQFSEFEVEVRDGQFVVRSTDIFAETIVLSIVNHLRTHSLMRKHGIKLRDILNEAVRVLHTKIPDLLKLPKGSVLEFGTRRRALAEVQALLFEIVFEETNGVIDASSNTGIAMRTGRPNPGTHPHAGYLLEQGIAYPQGDDAIYQSMMKFVDNWSALMLYPSLVWLTDQYGHEAFLEQWTKTRAENSRGYRWDSGPWKEWTDQVIQVNRKLEINLTDRYQGKDLVYSDGLDTKTMLEIYEYASPHVRSILFGWGTNLTNDLGVYAQRYGMKPISIVMKPTHVNGYPVVKLSANPAKVTGGSKVDQERIAHIFRYNRVKHKTVQPLV